MRFLAQSILLALLISAQVWLAALCVAQSRSGSEIYARFRDHLAEPQCAPDASERWREHFANTPGRMANSRDDVMPLFGYVVDTLIKFDLPTEFALIPFVESGYRPDAKSSDGPSGLWQMISITARGYGVPIRDGYDGRLSPVDSTQAAVRYLKTLYGMFAGDWRLAAMAYNAGENRILGALRRSGQQAHDVDLARLKDVPQITYAYVRKLHALACVLDEAHNRVQWRSAIDRQVPLLTDIKVPRGMNLESWAEREGLDVATLRRMNPAFGHGRVDNNRRVLAPESRAEQAFWPRDEIVFYVPATTVPDHGRSHVVRRGDSASRIALRYRVNTGELLRRNGLDESSILQPGMRLQID